jgi:hypothetical protein
MTIKGANTKDKVNPVVKSVFNAVPREAKDKIDGVGLTQKVDFCPERANDTGIELDINNRGQFQNSGIVFTRDRPSHYYSGRGGEGDTGASTIDIVAGYQSSTDPSQLPPLKHKDDRYLVDPDFSTDAARIYISQKTDVDFNFGLSPGTKGSPGLEGDNKKPTSTVAIKADTVRVVARENIKLVTGTDYRNSQGGKILGYGGIDLIAGNAVGDQQPIPLGDNLSDALKRLSTHVNNLAGIVGAFVTHQMDYNDVLADHFHLSPWWGIETVQIWEPWLTGVVTEINLQSQVQRSLSNIKASLASFQQTFLEDSGEKYINSRFNSVN